MTMQVPDTLEVGGERLRTHANPLGAYFAMAGIESPFYSFFSANWRGYVGAWAILGDRLYLAELRGSDQNEQPIVLKDLFPGYPDRVFVHWFSGEIRCPTGERIQAATRHIYRCEKTAFSRCDVVWLPATGSCITSRRSPFNRNSISRSF